MAENYKFVNYAGAEMAELFDKIADLDVATQSKAGLMSTTDKTKLDELPAGAQVNVLEGQSLYDTIPFDRVGYALLNNGVVSTSSKYNVTGYLSVKKGQRFLIKGLTGNSASWATVCGYSEQSAASFVEIIVPGFDGNTRQVTFEIPDGVAYIRACACNDTDPRFEIAYLGVFTTDIIKDNIGALQSSLQEQINVISQQVNESQTKVDELQAETKKLSYLNTAGEIVSSPNDGFAQFAGAIATFDTDHYSVDCSQSTGYCGLRNNLLGTQIRQIGKKCQISFWVKSEDEEHNFAFFYAPNTGKYLRLTPEWKEYVYEFNETQVATIDRIQFAFMDGGTSTFDIKGLSILIDGTIWASVDELSKQVDVLSSRDNPLKGKKVSIIGDSISSSARNNAPYWLIVASDVGNQIQSYVTWADIYADWEGTIPTNKTIGGVLLTREMNGTLQTFTPVAEDVGKTLGMGQVYNSSNIITWSERLCQKSGAIWLSDAAWSSARMTTGNYDDAGPIGGSTGYSDCTIGRLRKRKDDGSWDTPDVVLIYMGTNDMTHPSYAHIDNIDIMAGIPQNDLIDGVHQYKAAYYRCIQKVREAYPNAAIICCTLNVFKRINYAQFPTNNGVYTLPQMNDAIREIANTMGCGLIEFDKDGITFENCYPTYISDSATTPTHPNNTGHEVMAMKALADITYCL